MSTRRGLAMGTGVVSLVVATLWYVTLPVFPPAPAHSPPEVTDRALDPADNAFQLYMDGAKRLHFFGHNPTQARERLKQALTQQGSPATFLTDALAANQDALTHLAKGRRRTRMQVMPPAYDFKTPLPSFGTLQSLVYLGILHSRSHRQRGHHAKALASALDAWACSRRLVDAQGFLIGKLVGLSLIRRHWDALATEPNVLRRIPTAALVSYREELDGLAAGMQPIESLLVGERDERLRDLRGGVLSREFGRDSSNGTAWVARMFTKRVELATIPHTQAHFDRMSECLALRDFARMEHLDDRAQVRETGAWYSLGAILHPIDAGVRGLMEIATPSFVDYGLKALDGDAWFTAHRVQVALELYRRTHRTFPARLAELVPAYLPAIPADPYRPAMPLGYDRGRLWSVGWDGSDQRGLRSLPNKRARESTATGDRLLLVNGNPVPAALEP